MLVDLVPANSEMPKSPHDRALLQGRIDATDRRIDALVYDLYGLTAKEIGIVEGTTDKQQ